MKYITDISAASEAVIILGSELVVGLDIETAGLDPKTEQLRLIQIVLPTETYVFDLYRMSPGKHGIIRERRGRENMTNRVYGEGIEELLIEELLEEVTVTVAVEVRQTL